MSPVPLTPLDLLLGAGFASLAGLSSLALGLGIERRLAVAAVRMVAQLALVALALRFVLEQTSPWWTLLLGTAMVGAAGLEFAGRRTFATGWTSALATGTATLAIVGLLTTLFTLAVVIRPEPWYQPRYVLPILGMVLGNALTALALVLQTAIETARRERPAIEFRLALGASPREALASTLTTAVGAGILPIVNTMAATGIVSLPGMMTGQILAGADPIEAAKYQILIMLVLAGANALAAAGGALAAMALLIDRRHRLRLDRLEVKPERKPRQPPAR